MSEGFTKYLGWTLFAFMVFVWALTLTLYQFKESVVQSGYIRDARQDVASGFEQVSRSLQMLSQSSQAQQQRLDALEKKYGEAK